MLYIRSVVTIYNLYVAILEFGDDAACLLVEGVFNESDAGIKVDFQRIRATRQ